MNHNFYKRYLDIIINKNELIPEFDTNGKNNPEQSIIGKLIIENYCIIKSKYKKLTSQMIEDIIKLSIKIGNNYNNSDQRKQILNFGYYLDDNYNEKKNVESDNRYDGIIGVLDLFSYSFKITPNLIQIFNLFNENIGIYDYCIFFNKYRKQVTAPDSIEDIDSIEGIELFKLNSQILIQLSDSQQLQTTPRDSLQLIDDDMLLELHKPNVSKSSQKQTQGTSQSPIDSNQTDLLTKSRYMNLNNSDFKDNLYYLKRRLETLSQKIDKYKNSDNSHSYYVRVRDISDYRDFKTQTDREPQDFIAQIKLKNIGGKQNMSKYKYVTENSLGKAVNNSRARELANNYNRLTDKMIETEKKIGGIQKLAIHDLSKSQNGYVRMRGGEQQTINYNNLIKQYQLMAIKQNNIINEIKNIKNHY